MGLTQEFYTSLHDFRSEQVPVPNGVLLVLLTKVLHQNPNVQFWTRYSQKRTYRQNIWGGLTRFQRRLGTCQRKSNCLLFE